MRQVIFENREDPLDHAQHIYIVFIQDNVEMHAEFAPYKLDCAFAIISWLNAGKIRMELMQD